MPTQLVDDLANPKIRWIIFINPPYAMSGNSKDGKASLTNTAIRKLMQKDYFGVVSRELASQFIYRISREFKGRLAWLSLFSKAKYLTANNDQKLRDKVFSYKFLRGFLFSSQNLDGCKGEFTVDFLIWHLNQKIPLSEQKITLYVYNKQVEKIAENFLVAFLHLSNDFTFQRYTTFLSAPYVSIQFRYGMSNKRARLIEYRIIFSRSS